MGLIDSFITGLELREAFDKQVDKSRNHEYSNHILTIHNTRNVDIFFAFCFPEFGISYGWQPVLRGEIRSIKTIVKRHGGTLLYVHGRAADATPGRGPQWHGNGKPFAVGFPAGNFTGQEKYQIRFSARQRPHFTEASHIDASRLRNVASREIRLGGDFTLEIISPGVAR